MIKTKFVLKIVCASLAILSLASCSGIKKTKEGRMDYFNTDMTKLVDLQKEDYQKLTVTLPDEYIVNDKVIDDHITKELYNNRKEINGGQGQVERPVKYGDLAYVYYEGFIDGKPFKDSSNLESFEGARVNVGSGEFFAEGFEEALIGIVPKETSKENRITINAKIPETYAIIPEIAGKDVVFYAYIAKSAEYETYTLEDLNNKDISDTIIKDTLGYTPADPNATGLLEEYRMYVRKNIEVINEAVTREVVCENIFAQIISKAEFKEIPKCELDFYKKQYTDGYASDMAYAVSQGASYASLDDYICDVREYAKGTDWQAIFEEEYTFIIKTQIICHAIAQLEGMKITRSEYEQEINYYIDGENAVNRDDVIENVGEYTLYLNTMYSKISTYLYERAIIIYQE